MNVLQVIGIFCIIPTTVLFTISFFVMYTISKTDKKALRIFGMVAAAMLLIASSLVFSTGIYVTASNSAFPHRSFPAFGQGFGKCCCDRFDCPCSDNMPGCAMTGKAGFHERWMRDPYHKMFKDPHRGMMINPHQKNLKGKTTEQEEEELLWDKDEPLD